MEVSIGTTSLLSLAPAVERGAALALALEAPAALAESVIARKPVVGRGIAVSYSGSEAVLSIEPRIGELHMSRKRTRTSWISSAVRMLSFR